MGPERPRLCPTQAPRGTRTRGPGPSFEHRVSLLRDSDAAVGAAHVMGTAGTATLLPRGLEPSEWRGWSRGGMVSGRAASQMVTLLLVTASEPRPADARALEKQSQESLFLSSEVCRGAGEKGGAGCGQQSTGMEPSEASTAGSGGTQGALIPELSPTPQPQDGPPQLPGPGRPPRPCECPSGFPSARCPTEP